MPNSGIEPIMQGMPVASHMEKDFRRVEQAACLRHVDIGDVRGAPADDLHRRAGIADALIGHERHPDGAAHLGRHPIQIVRGQRGCSTNSRSNGSIAVNYFDRLLRRSLPVYVAIDAAAGLSGPMARRTALTAATSRAGIARSPTLTLMRAVARLHPLSFARAAIWSGVPKGIE